MSKSKKVSKSLPSWIVVTADDPKLQKAIENKIAEKLVEKADLLLFAKSRQVTNLSVQMGTPTSNV